MLRQWLNRRRVFRERRALAEQRRQADHARDRPDHELLVDPIESDPQIRPLLIEAERLAEEQLAGRPRGMGFCHLLWQTKRRILADRFQIAWFSPADLNEEWVFD